MEAPALTRTGPPPSELVAETSYSSTGLFPGTDAIHETTRPAPHDAWTLVGGEGGMVAAWVSKRTGALTGPEPAISRLRTVRE